MMWAVTRSWREAGQWPWVSLYALIAVRRAFAGAFDAAVQDCGVLGGAGGVDEEGPRSRGSATLSST